jgi:N-acetylneuraminic acid mutarotase
MSLTSWNTLPVNLPVTLQDASAVTSPDGYIYLIGGASSEGLDMDGNLVFKFFNTVYSAKMNSDGTTSSWTLLSETLPVNIWRASAVTSKDGYIYLIGGSGGLDTVYSAKMNSGGTTSSWTLLSETLPSGLQYASAVTSKDGYIYLIGGLDDDIGVNTVYSAKMNSDGTTSSWTSLPETLPSGLFYASTVASTDGFIYFCGGGNDLIDSRTNTVYSAKMTSVGTLEGWITLEPLPIMIGYGSAVISQYGYIYLVGGYRQPNGSGVLYAKINSNGSLGAWTSLAQTINFEQISLASAVTSVYGYIYLMGGGKPQTSAPSTNIVSSAKMLSPTPTPISNICFPSGTPIQTDQGIIPIEQINRLQHTINGQTIQHITKTVTMDKHLICFKKNSLGKNYPSRDTIMSCEHKIEYDGKLAAAYRFLDLTDQVVKVKYTGEILYNVLLVKYGTMSVNNLTCETLHPENIIAKLYTSNFSETSVNSIVVLMNEALINKDLPAYKHALKQLI